MTMISPAQMRMARAGLGWGVRELAERAGLQPGTISRIENGKEAMGGAFGRSRRCSRKRVSTFPTKTPSQ